VGRPAGYGESSHSPAVGWPCRSEELQVTVRGQGICPVNIPHVAHPWAVGGFETWGPWGGLFFFSYYSSASFKEYVFDFVQPQGEGLF